ncbi:hypothetical protein ABUE31_21095 [Mesorhizobium sp. ZMM04-5]|uniref:Lipoprotein n=1 Tax=Mesorhizobium marinum TaxID=3228790 RepID=A0ABV3R5Z6_9HYPH
MAIFVAACQTDSQTTSATSSPRAESSSSKPVKLGAKQPNKAGRYFIEFRSRYAYTYGHSYVVFGTLDARGRMVKPEVAGLAPKSDDPSVYMAGHVLPVESTTGWTDGDLEPEYMSAYWRVMLTEPEYRKVVANIRKLQASSPVWHASIYNCNAFVGDIARSMGYKTPFHWLVPQEYITKLRKMNGGPNAIGWTRPDSDAPSSSKTR